MEELYKLWKHHTTHVRELCQRKEYTEQQVNKNNTKFKLGQPVMVKNHACQTSEPKYLLDNKVFIIINDSTLFLISQMEKKEKQILKMLNLAVKQSL